MILRLLNRFKPLTAALAATLASLAAITTSRLLAAAPEALDLGHCLTIALARNPSLLATEQRWKAASHSREAAGSTRGPALKLHDSYDSSDRRFNSFPGFGATQPQVSHIADLELVQPVYSGGRLEAAERQAGFDEERARWDLAETRHGVVESVVRSYLDWLQQRDLNDYYRSAIGRDQRLENEIATRVHAGRALDADRLQAHIRVLDDQKSLFEGETRANLARSLLLTQMDMPPDSPLTPVNDLTMLDGLAAPDSPGGAGVEGNAALRATSAAVEAARQEVRKAQAEYRPTLDLAVRRSHVFSGLSFFSSDADYDDYLAVVDLPLFDSGLRREKKKAAKANFAASADEYRNQRLQKELELTRAKLDLEEASRRVGLATDKRSAAGENLRVAKERYDAGTVLLSEVNTATVNVTLASVEEITSRFDVYRAKVAILRIQGRLLEQATARR